MGGFRQVEVELIRYRAYLGEGAWTEELRCSRSTWRAWCRKQGALFYSVNTLTAPAARRS